MKNTLETRLGLFTAIIVIAAILVLETLGGLENLKQGKRVHALFNSAMELKEGDRVKMAGVEIGRVEKIQLTDSKVKVTLKLKSDALVKTDSTATIRFAGLLGQNFISLDFGSPSAGLADNNTYLPTAEQPDLSAIFQRLDNVAAGVENLTKSFSGDKIDNILGPLTDFFKQNNSQFSATVTNIKVITSQIAEGKGTVGKLIMDDSLYNSTLTAITNLQDTGNDLRATIADARSIMADAKAGKGTVGKLITDEALYRETTDSMTNLKEVLQKVNRGQGSVGKLVNEDEFYKNAKMTLQKLDKATEGLEDQGPITVMGTLFSTFY
jgi:phospholipid/cholesterol/gamma-HCH transport system substrate-binding protein